MYSIAREKPFGEKSVSQSNLSAQSRKVCASLPLLHTVANVPYGLVLVGGGGGGRTGVVQLCQIQSAVSGAQRNT